MLKYLIAVAFIVVAGITSPEQTNAAGPCNPAVQKCI